jgi:tRNA (guanine-N7-)-methyltransferase
MDVDFYLNNHIEDDFYLPRGMELPEKYRKRLDFFQLFNNNNPVIVEIGFGNGQFLANLAKNHPNKNFIGIELSRLSIVKLQELIDKHSLENIRYFFMDAKMVFKYLLPSESVNEIYINFPDPWPKRRHHKHRFIQEETLEYLYPILEKAGKINFVTDDWPYAVWTAQVFRLFLGKKYKNLFFPFWYKNSISSFFLTKYACKWLEMGKDLYFQRYEKVSAD